MKLAVEFVCLPWAPFVFIHISSNDRAVGSFTHLIASDSLLPQ